MSIYEYESGVRKGALREWVGVSERWKRWQVILSRWAPYPGKQLVLRSAQRLDALIICN